MESNQRYYPQFGYDAPRKTKGECTNPAFADRNLHRIGVFADNYLDDGLTGYSCIYKCVNCGKVFRKKTFKPSRKLVEVLPKEGK